MNKEDAHFGDSLSNLFKNQRYQRHQRPKILFKKTYSSVKGDSHV